MRVIVVDDSLTNCSLLSMLIRHSSLHEVVCFTNPVEALANMKETPFDIGIFDFMMPGLNGIDLIRLLRHIPSTRNLPMVIVTSFDEMDIRVEALEAGATEFLSKPVNATEFRARFNNLVALRQSQIDSEQRADVLTARVNEATLGILRREEELIMRLARASEFKDGETGQHILRVAAYAREIAEELGEPEEFCRNIYLAAPMHDVGKVGIPDSILLKPGKLDSDEWEMMKRHTELGFEILNGSESELVRLAAEIAISHHEKWDGTGYPAGTSGEDIPLPARIVAVADVFDALTSERPYKRAWDVEDAFRQIKSSSGSHFDPACVAAFERRRDNILKIRAVSEAEERNHQFLPANHSSKPRASNISPFRIVS